MKIIQRCKYWQTWSKPLRGLVALPSQKCTLNHFEVQRSSSGKGSERPYFVHEAKHQVWWQPGLERVLVGSQAEGSRLVSTGWMSPWASILPPRFPPEEHGGPCSRVHLQMFPSSSALSWELWSSNPIFKCSFREIRDWNQVETAHKCRFASAHDGMHGIWVGASDKL